ncbi:MAG: hypothetical protein R2932_59485 [Caldilineaceae bacterium]
MTRNLGRLLDDAQKHIFRAIFCILPLPDPLKTKMGGDPPGVDYLG